MGYRIIEYGGKKYKLTPKWYKEYLSAIVLWEKAKETDVKDLDKSELVDIRDVKIDSKKPYLIRIISYINQVRNPYCYRVGDVVKFKVTVTNTGDVAGDEVVQIYVEDCESSVVTPRVLLKDFKRVTLAPGEEKTIEFNLGYNAFRLMNQAYEWVVEPGTFKISAGSSSRDLHLTEEIEL